MNKGKVIVVEGLDGAGKSTAINAISEQLKLQGIESLVLAEPGGTVIGKWLRNYVKSLDTPVLDPDSETLLFFLSRSVLINDVIKPALAKGTVVILDRFYRTTVAYQGYGLNKGKLPLINSLVKNLELSELIDLELLLDVPVITSRERIGLRFTDCQIEKRNSDFYQRARNGYLLEAAQYDYIKTIDGTQSKDQVSAEVLQHIKSIL